MRSSERDLHTGLKCHTVHRGRYLTDTTARFLYDLATAVRGRFLISLFRRALSYDLIKGKLLTWLNDGSVDGLSGKLYIRISLLICGSLRRERGESLILFSRVRLGKLRLALIDLGLDHGIIISACRRLHEILYKLLLIHRLTRGSARKQELIRRCIILGNRAVLRLHVPLCSRVRRRLCRRCLQIFRIFNRKGIFSLRSSRADLVQKRIQIRIDQIIRVNTLPVTGDRHLPRIFFFNSGLRLTSRHSL